MARKTIVLSWLLVVLALAGCGGDTPPAEAGPEAAPPETATEPQSGDGPTLVGSGRLVRIEDEALRVVRGYTQLFYEGDLAELHERFTEEFKSRFPSRAWSSCAKACAPNWARRSRSSGRSRRKRASTAGSCAGPGSRSTTA